VCCVTLSESLEVVDALSFTVLLCDFVLAGRSW
jgi:hypothetical protein